MIAEANGIGGQNPNGDMPGQLQGEAGVLDFEPDVADQAPIVGGAEGDGTDDEADIAVRGVKNSLTLSLRLVFTFHNSRFRLGSYEM